MTETRLLTMCNYNLFILFHLYFCGDPANFKGVA